MLVGPAAIVMARRRRLSGHRRGHPVPAALRPALPERDQVRRPVQLWPRPQLDGLVAGRPAHGDHHRDQREHPVRARDAARAGDAPGDLRSGRSPGHRPDSVRNRRRRGGVLVAVRVVAEQRLDPEAAGTEQRPAEPPVRELRGDHHHRDLEEHAVHGPAAAGRTGAWCPTSCTRRHGSTARPHGSASSGSRCR